MQEVEDFEIGLVRREPGEEELTSNKKQARVNEEPIPRDTLDELVPEETAKEVPIEVENAENTHEAEIEVNGNEVENTRNTPVDESEPGETSERRVLIRDFQPKS